MNRYTLKGDGEMEVDLITFGGIITAIRVPSNSGKLENVVLGFDDLESYKQDSAFLGALVGRYANRIANSRFRINGELYRLNSNEGKHQLHGGDSGFHNVIWNVEEESYNQLVLSHVSPDGSGGFPGNLRVKVSYTLTSRNELVLRYEGKTDKTTHVNFTNHPYFNLSGDFSKKILDHKLTLLADRYTPVDRESIPTGDILNVEGTPFDFRRGKRIDENIDQTSGGYDHNFVLNKTSEKELSKAAQLLHPESGRRLVIFTTEPGLQFYDGGGLDSGPFSAHSGLCLEPQHFPDSPNHPEFPSTLLKPGDLFQSQTVYRFSTEP